MATPKESLSEYLLVTQKWLPTKCFKRHNKTYISNSDNNNTFNDNDIDVAVRIYINIKYSEETADRLIKQCMKKLQKCFKLDKRVKFVLQYKTTKLSHFTNKKNIYIYITKPFYFARKHIRLKHKDHP